MSHDVKSDSTDLQDLKNNFTIGYVNGIVIGACWGLFYGPFQLNADNSTKKKIVQSMLRYQKQSLIKLPPMSALVRVTAGYLDSNGYSQITSMTAQILVCFGYLTLIKFPK